MRRIRKLSCVDLAAHTARDKAARRGEFLHHEEALDAAYSIILCTCTSSSTVQPRTSWWFCAGRSDFFVNAAEIQASLPRDRVGIVDAQAPVVLLGHATGLFPDVKLSRFVNVLEKVQVAARQTELLDTLSGHL